MISVSSSNIADVYVGSISIAKAYMGSALIWEKITYDDKYPIINVIDGVNYYRFTPKESFIVYSGNGGGNDQISYYYFGSTTRYDYNRMWGAQKTYTGPNTEPPRYFNLRLYTANGYIYNKTRKEWLYRGSNVPEDMFDT